jgi:tetratricopeptide (TPR) repeat protein
VLLALLAVASVPAVAVAAECVDGIARAVSVQGSVQVRRAGETRWVDVRLDDPFCPGDLLRLRARSRAAVLLRSGAILRLDQHTTIAFVPTAPLDASWIDLLLGAVHFISRITRGLTIQTPFVNGTVEGTEFWVEVTPSEATFTVLDGRLTASNASGTLAVASGQSAVGRAGQPPILRPVAVTPTDAVQWALHYPPLPRPRPGEFPDRSGEPWRASVRRSLEAAFRGELEAAFDALASVPPDVVDPRVLLFRADLLLSVGRVDEATADIDRVLAGDPANSPALALRSVIAVTRNATTEALGLARHAVERDPRSPVARVALSYAQQASFDLEGARASADEAVALAPDDALPRARLAELWLSLGRLDRALVAAREAERLDPRLGRAQVVLGFTLLTQVRPAEAAQAFEAAIRADQADPLARLGLGLAKIRRGDLEAGRDELEVAVSLDPGQALLRSYLGKAYYEEKRDARAAEQLGLARTLDARDPTPWLYDAIRLHSINRPVEALQALERSIELNDNRAVYRSRLLLDADRATRSATLARLYDELGFPQRALVEGWTSLHTDPASYSAHRFLADAYAALSRHEIARGSEVLQSQLLQPVSINPVPPQLALARSFILAGTGPSTAGFNEFDSLFERNRFSLRASGAAGTQATWGDEVVASVLRDGLAVSAGQFHYETDGFRANNDQKQDLYDLFVQWSPSADTSVQAELQASRFDRGDLFLRFDPENFQPELRQEDEILTARLGLRQQFAPESVLLASLVYGTAEFDTTVQPGVTLTTDEERYSAELQHLFRHARLGLVGGGGYFQVERSDRFLDLPATETTIRHGNLYAYSYVPLGRLVATLGGSADFFSGGIRDRDQVNPKVGVLWRSRSGATLRAAAFRTLKRTLITNQTLEPTQVAGFNQFFDDPEATDAWRYGVGVDQVIGRSFFAGVEVSRRDLDVPALDLTGSEPRVTTTDEQENLGRAYVYWAPHPWLALVVEYQYEELERDPEARNEGQVAEVRTHRVPLAVGFFHPSGLMAWLRATWVSQDGTFRDAAGDLVRGSDSFWVVDASLGYRLPRRWGIVSVEARNLLDERFRFQETDPVRPTLAPERAVLVRFTVAY